MRPATLAKFRILMLAAAVLMSSIATASAQVALDDEFARDPTWKPTTAVEIREQVVKWLDAAKPDTETRQMALAMWPEAADPKTATDDVLERAVATITLVDPRGKEIADLCTQPHALAATPDFAWLTDEKTPALVRNNLRLALGKWLAQERRYDEALALLKDLQPTDVVDPASLLFYQSVCYHWTLHKTEGLAAINKLLEQRKSIPHRYEQLAELMQADLNGLEDDSLDHISRRMNDVTRRLDIGHAGKQVRGVEDGIVASLDKLIKQMEDMANRRGNGSGQGEGQGQGEGRQPGNNSGDPNGIQSSSPASRSSAAHGRGPGEVKAKNIGNQSGWGDLPAKEREEAMQQISREFPSHYRDVIEQYFRKLASEEEQK